MHDLAGFEYVLIGIIFIWGGFVRAALGFGGAALTLPFLLLIVPDPLVFLPIIGMHLLIFSVWITWNEHRRNRGQAAGSSVDWVFLRRSLAIIIVPKMIGILGLLTFPPWALSTFVYFAVLLYAIPAVLKKPIASDSGIKDWLFLIGGGYLSGSSLVGAPLIVAVFSARVSAYQLRNTLFVLWFILVVIKLISFMAVGVDMQWAQHLWLLPCAFIGHLIGEAVHRRMLLLKPSSFMQWIGMALILVSSVGMLQMFLAR